LLNGCSETDQEKTFQAFAKLDTNRVGIGDVFHYKVVASAPKNKMLQFSEIRNNDPLEIRHTLLNADGTRLDSIDFTLVLWDTGFHYIPPIEVNLLNSDSTLAKTMTMDSLQVFVFSSIAEDSLFRAAGSINLKPAKNPVSIEKGFPFRTLLFGTTFLILLVLIIGIWFRRVPDRFRFSEPLLDIPPPDELALKKLTDLRKQIKQDGRTVKEYYTSLSHIIREYIEFSFFIKTLEMTTEDIVKHTDDLPFGSTGKGAWKNILERADLVKYAKETSDVETIQLDIDSTQKFIKNTTIFWKRIDTSLP